MAFAPSLLLLRLEDTWLPSEEMPAQRSLNERPAEESSTPQLLELEYASGEMMGLFEVAAAAAAAAALWACLKEASRDPSLDEPLCPVTSLSASFSRELSFRSLVQVASLLFLCKRCDGRPSFFGRSRPGEQSPASRLLLNDDFRAGS